jgi:LysM repeat protein
MNNPNPLIPQGSLLEQQAKGKPHLRIALCIVAVHVVFLGLLLMQGCKREDEPLPMSELTPEESPYGRLDVATLYPTNAEVAELEPEPAAEPRRLDVVEVPDRAAPPVIPPREASVPEVKTAPTEPARVREHSVEAGDTYTSIAKEYKTTVSAIAKANPGVDPTRLRVKQRLLVPPPEAAVTGGGAVVEPALPAGVEAYKVKAGDTLTGIARAHGTTVTAIRELNGLTTDRINVGQQLRVPGGGGSGTREVVPERAFNP